MQLPSSTKTEQRAVNALETIIDEQSTMIHRFDKLVCHYIRKFLKLFTREDTLYV